MFAVIFDRKALFLGVQEFRSEGVQTYVFFLGVQEDRRT